MLQTTSISQHNLNSIDMTAHNQIHLYSIIHKYVKETKKKTFYYLTTVE